MRTAIRDFTTGSEEFSKMYSKIACEVESVFSWSEEFLLCDFAVGVSSEARGGW